MNVGLYHHELFHRHDTGAHHPERAGRLTAILEALDQAGLSEQLLRPSFEPATVEMIAAVHDPDYIQVVEQACRRGVEFIGSLDTHISEMSYEAARLAAGAAVAAVDAVLDEQLDRAFCAVRPPGHHAERQQALGFCLFNNIAIAAEHLVRTRRLERVAIVDVDVHHGNGTQHAFERRGDVLFISMHEHPRFLFPHSGEASETGVAAGEGATLNIPMLPGADDDAYRQAFEEQVIPAIDRFCPQFVLMDIGFDATANDPLADMLLSPRMFHWMTRQLMDAAGRHADGRFVSMLEGGYHLDDVRQSVVQHVEALLGR